ncbi:rho gtpase-activating protein 68f [Anaeramoeba ignava]|uniref:Rho gtpase-activating protein 68f n=1 Tax=Anaeramoeba ignava TaxID=1746090 RepID=A0A9Q0LC11_ANAIG|nr:rho gtpase-activating protein 68f [Anaeramoeba ignava]
MTTYNIAAVFAPNLWSKNRNDLSVGNAFPIQQMLVNYEQIFNKQSLINSVNFLDNQEIQIRQNNSEKDEIKERLNKRKKKGYNIDVLLDSEQKKALAKTLKILNNKSDNTKNKQRSNYNIQKYLKILIPFIILIIFLILFKLLTKKNKQ